VIRIPPMSRAIAETTLTSTGVATRPGTDTVHPATGAVTAGQATPVWSGVCSLSPATRDDRTHTLGDDRILGAMIARLPATADTHSTASGDPLAVRTGDHLAIDGDTYVVRTILRRSTEILRRLIVQRATDTEGVPR